jgi:glucosyl-3-phosphoglycerate synthase
MVTVIIPAYNEEATIKQVIQIVKKSNFVSEIIVIDDKSTDNTVQEAKSEQVKIFTSSVRGKGSSMREGILLAKNDIIAFIDADITTYPKNVIDILAKPIIDNEADFVKSYFKRQAGRVTELVAKPLLSFLFPSISKFKQPLSGMIAGKKSLLLKVDIEDDYGVDIGILIDMHQKGAKIKEVSLGYIENRMQSIFQLGKMSKEVTYAILKRSGQFLEDTVELFTGYQFNDSNKQIDFAIKNSTKGLKKLAIFDMDKTILQQSFIHTLAEKFNFKQALDEIVLLSASPFIRIKQIAQLLQGLSITDILKTADEMPFTEDAKQVIDELKRKGYICGIISESYDVVANHIANKLGMHFSLANELEFNKSVAIGEVKIPSFFLKTKNSICNHDYCKSNAVQVLIKKYGIDLKNVMAMGNGKNDVCMVQHAGTGIAFCADNKALGKVSNHEIFVPQFRSVLLFISCAKL